MATEVELLESLNELGTEQNRKIYKRHGVGDDVCGVSFANLNKLARQIKTDHATALRLWATGNYEARTLATMIADPRQADDALLEAWAGDLDSYPISDSFTAYVARTSLAREKMAEWIESPGEWVASVGWNLLGQLALHDETLPDSFFEGYLERIEREIHASKNRVRYSMNGALIAIGTRSDDLERRAVDAARRIGKVVVDHGKTGCKTPDAVEYIARARERARR